MNKKKQQVKKRITKLAMSGKKVIKIDVQTHARLSKLGAKEDTFDSVIRRLLDDYQQQQ